jgi:hypothetical protein
VNHPKLSIIPWGFFISNEGVDTNLADVYTSSEGELFTVLKDGSIRKTIVHICDISNYKTVYYSPISDISWRDVHFILDQQAYCISIASSQTNPGIGIPIYRNCVVADQCTTTIYFDLLCLTPLSAISWRPVLVVEEAGVFVVNHRPWASNW